jgi:hypothetical protein
VTDLAFQALNELRCPCLVGFQVEPLDLLAHDPIGHRVDIETNDVTAKAVCLKEGGATSHEGVSDTDVA